VVQIHIQKSKSPNLQTIIPSNSKHTNMQMQAIVDHKNIFWMFLWGCQDEQSWTFILCLFSIKKQHEGYCSTNLIRMKASSLTSFEIRATHYCHGHWCLKREL
jgi:hypothetical protein